MTEPGAVPPRSMRRGRRIAVDVGDVRIGVAACDRDGILASPLETVAAGKLAVARLAEIVHEVEAIECVVGLPIGLSGREGPAAAKIRAFCEDLSRAIDPVTIRLVDERMSTMTADALLRQQGRSGVDRRKVIDQAAAAVILETALDAERMRGTAPGEIFERSDQRCNGDS